MVHKVVLYLFHLLSVDLLYKFWRCHKLQNHAEHDPIIRPNVLTSHITDNYRVNFNLRWWLPRLLQERSAVVFVEDCWRSEIWEHSLCMKVIKSNLLIVSQP